MIWFFVFIGFIIWGSIMFFAGAMIGAQPEDISDDDAQAAYLAEWVEGHRWDR